MAVKPLLMTLTEPSALSNDAEGRPVVTSITTRVRGNAGLLSVTQETPITGTTQQGAVGLAHRAWATLALKDENRVLIEPKIGGGLIIADRAAAADWEISGVERTPLHWRLGLVRRVV